MRNAGNLDFSEAFRVFPDAERDVGKTNQGQLRVAIRHRVVSGQNLSEGTLGRDHVGDELEWLARERVVGELRLLLVARILPVEPTKVRPQLLVEQLDRVFAAEVFVGQEVVVVELDHPVVELLVAHHLCERCLES